MANILIVDDRAGNRDFLATLLAYKGHQLVEAADGVKALAHIREKRPDLVITDILMPAMDGYEFTRRLREDPRTASIPVIFFSANYLLEEARELASRCGVKHLLTKPCDPEDVLRTVDAALGRNEAEFQAPPVEEFDREHVRVLTDKLSQKAGELRQLNSRLEALIELGARLNVAQDPASLFKTYSDAARDIVGANCASVCLSDEGGREIRRCCSTGEEACAAEDAGGVCPIEHAKTEVLLDRKCRRGRVTESRSETTVCPISFTPFSAYLIVPILTHTRMYGCLMVGNGAGRPDFTTDDERLLGMLAAQLAVAYENTRLFEELKLRAAQLEAEVAERRQSAEKYQMVLEQASDGIAISDELGNYVEANPRLLEMLGYTRDEFLRLKMADLIPAEELARDPITLDPLRAGMIIRKERRFLRRDGNGLEVEISMSRLQDGRVQSIVRDVEERKKLEHQLRQSQKLEAVGRLAGGVAHDFNNLLTVILGHADLALSGLEENDRRRLDIQDIREAGARAAVLTAQLLAFSRKQILQPKVLNVNTAVSNLTKMLGRLIGSDIEVRTALAPDLWAARVDPVQLDQVILNLAVNARDAMPLGGELAIETANRRFGEQPTKHHDIPDGEYVMLALRDTGCGMDPETRSHLFEPFFTTKPAGKGTGLGLSTVYGIVRQSGGYISVSSEPGRGSIFEIYLPRIAGAAETAAPRMENGPLPSGTETVLIVEDEQRVRSLASIVLVQQGYNVLEAADGQEALRLASNYAGQIHLVFTDIVMPKMGGREVAVELRRSRPDIKVLFCSGYTGDAITRQGALDPSTPLLQKPFTPRSLAVKVREVLDGAAEPDPVARLAEREPERDPAVQ
ncbi:MAG TPA: response regulator [Bryobacteraceae bacterium]|nr:response regulator [Bryobacteraceae bacterium]